MVFWGALTKLFRQSLSVVPFVLAFTWDELQPQTSPSLCYRQLPSHRPTLPTCLGSRLCLRLASASNLNPTSLNNHHPTPLSCVQTDFRLEAVPEMGYSPSADPPAGEVCIRGPGIFTEYYKNKEMTKEAMGGLC